MKYIDVDPDAILLDLKTDWTKSYIARAKRVLEDPRVQAAIIENDFDTVYDLARNIENKTVISVVTMFLLAAGIDVLQYITYIPALCFDEIHSLIKKLIIPKHIKKIGEEPFRDSVSEVYYEGTKEELLGIKIQYASFLGVTKVICSDGYYDVDDWGDIIL